ncbi:hypothetical protein [Actinocorallia herbida]|nr:hypothetical protein [Actinocorallia herbida]
MSDGVSPIATGGAGTIFEYRVAAVLLGRLLRGALVPIGMRLPMGWVELQQGIDGRDFDDIVVTAGGENPAPSIEIQVKRRLRITGSDADFIKVMRTAAGVCQTRGKELVKGRLLLGLAVGDDDGTGPLSELTEMARARRDHESLARLLRPGVTREELRIRHSHVVKAVATAVSISDGAQAEALSHRILAGLHVWRVDVGPEGSDWREELDLLDDLASACDRTSSDLLNLLCAFAQELGPRAGQVDAARVRAELLRAHGIDLPLHQNAATAPSSSPRFTIVNHSGTVFAAENQTFNNPQFGR